MQLHPAAGRSPSPRRIDAVSAHTSLARRNAPRYARPVTPQRESSPVCNGAVPIRSLRSNDKRSVRTTVRSADELGRHMSDSTGRKLDLRHRELWRKMGLSPLKNGSISRPTTFHPVHRAIPSGHGPLSISAPYRCHICTVISAILRRRHDPRTKRKTLRTSCRGSFRRWHLSIVPGRFQPSIVDTSELNCRVRDGNGCTLTVIDTNYLRLSPPISSRSSRGDTLRTE